MTRSFSAALGALALAACATTSQVESPAAAPARDPRVGLRAGLTDAAEAVSNFRVVSRTARPAGFANPANPGDFSFMNSDLAFRGNHVIQGNFNGIQVWDISRPAQPSLVTALVCPGAQNDVSVHGNLLFVSVEATSGRVDCGTQGVPDSVSSERMLGIRIFDISDISRPRPIANVQTCRGSHTHTLVTDPGDAANVYIYVSGSSPVRSKSELAGCSGAQPDADPNTALFRIEVIQVPLANPAQARIVNYAPILSGLPEAASHGPAPEDIAAAARRAADARTRGAFTATLGGVEQVAPSGFVNRLLDSMVTARGGTPPPTAADSAALRGAFQGIVDRMFGPTPSAGPRPGPSQCHDITVYPALGLAGGACGGYGVLLDIRDVKNPRRIGAVADSNFAFWHSATFNNDGTTILFTDEWGGGLSPRCRATDKPEWGANAFFTLQGATMTFRSYFKLPAPQTPQENCVAHNGSLIPVPGRDLFVQAWYQGGISLIDFTDPARPVEVAYYDRGPMDSTRMLGAGSWSAYWYNGYIVSSEIARGLDILELVPSPQLTQNEIDAAKLVRFEVFNAQNQPKLGWPAHAAVSRAYLDQLARSNGLAAARIAATRTELARAEGLSGIPRADALAALADQLERDAPGAPDQAKVRKLAKSVRDLAAARRT